MVTSQGQVLTQALSQGTIQIQNAQVRGCALTFPSLPNPHALPLSQTPTPSLSPSLPNPHSLPPSLLHSLKERQLTQFASEKLAKPQTRRRH